jgi:hypothetical protein
MSVSVSESVSVSVSVPVSMPVSAEEPGSVVSGMTGSVEVTPDKSPSGSVVEESETPVPEDDPRRG